MPSPPARRPVPRPASGPAPGPDSADRSTTRETRAGVRVNVLLDADVAGIAEDVEVVLDACRSLVAISAWSVDAVADDVDLVELRVLVLLATRGAASLRDLADTVGLHVTRASRLCDRMVGKGLLTRHDDPDDRRVLRLGLTRAGERLVQRVMDARRQAIAPVLAAMSPTARKQLSRGLRAFATASGEATEADLSVLGWAGLAPPRASDAAPPPA